MKSFLGLKKLFLPWVLCSIAAPPWIFLLYFVSRSVQPRCLWQARLSLARLRTRASPGTWAVCFLNITRRRWLAARPIDPSHRIKVSMGAAEFAVGPHPERAVRGSRRCPEEWQVLKRLQEGLTAASALSSPCIKGESSLWQFAPLSPLCFFPLRSSGVAGPILLSQGRQCQSMSESSQSASPTLQRRHTHPCFPLLSLL